MIYIGVIIVAISVMILEMRIRKTVENRKKKADYIKNNTVLVYLDTLEGQMIQDYELNKFKGMCIILTDITDNLSSDDSIELSYNELDYIEWEIKEKLNEIASNMPGFRPDHMYWFPLLDMKSRLEVINKLRERL